MAPARQEPSNLGLHKQQKISSFFALQPAPHDALAATRDGEQRRPADDSAANKPLQRPSAASIVALNAHAPPTQLSPPAKRRKLSSPSELPILAAQPAPIELRSRASQYLLRSSSDSAPNAISSEDATSALKTKLHLSFVKKLGGPHQSLLPLTRRSESIDDCAEDAHRDGGDSEHDIVEHSRAPVMRKRSSGAHKLTPMERQVIEIKNANKDTLLVVEVGYKYRFFGHDAQLAAKELGIVCIPGKVDIDEHFAPWEERFASASIPTHRLHVHVKRLVSAGHKVGIVRQLETAALKAAGDNRNAPFVRKLTDLYTKGTYIDEGFDIEADEAGLGSGQILCLTETTARGQGPDENVHIGLVAVQPATGDVIYDDFEDGFLRLELETRLLHIAPCEILINGKLSKATERLIEHLSSSNTTALGDRARVDRIAKSELGAAQAYANVEKFYQGKARDPMGTGQLCERVSELTGHSIVCLSVLIDHLADYNLEHVFDLTSNFQPFNIRSHMLLNGNTLASLEIYINQTDYTGKGSLLWTLDQTVTRAGQRLLRKWVGRPLLNQEHVDERLEAVEQLISAPQSAQTARLRKLLKEIRGDLEKSLIRIYYGRCTRPELLSFLQTLQKVAQEYRPFPTPSEPCPFSSALLSSSIAALPLVLPQVLKLLERINLQAAKDDDKKAFFRDEYASVDIINYKAGISAVKEDLEAHRATLAEKLKVKHIEYTMVAGIDFLIEVDNSKLSNVPASWSKISGTKKVSRFHSPEVIDMIRERDRQNEALLEACQAAYQVFLAEIATEYQSFRNCIQALSTLDCLTSLAVVASRPGYCRPTFGRHNAISVRAGRHPIVEQISADRYVANDVQLDSMSTRGLLITGPNMGGKSSYVRQVALTCIMAQIGSFVPAQEAHLGLLDSIYTRMGAFDNMLAGESTFMVELNETAEIIRQAGSRSLVILDELGRGTSTNDGVAIAHAVLEHFMQQTNALLLFITHYQSLSAVKNRYRANCLQNAHMRFAQGAFEDEDGAENITFLYELGKGTSLRSYGLNVARLAQMPQDVLDLARQKSDALESLFQREGQSSLQLLAQIAL